MTQTGQRSLCVATGTRNQEPLRPEPGGRVVGTCCRPTCRRWNGSADFQGSVVEGLFEFPNSKPVDPSQFYYSASVEHFCANPFGCRGW